MNMPIRIVSYNVRYFSHGLRGLAATRRSLTRIASAIAQLEPPPQLVCLQEVEAQSRRSRSAQPQLEAFCEALGSSTLRGVYFPAHVAGRGDRPLYTTGLAMLFDTQRFGLVEQTTLALNEDGERRIAAHLSLQGLVGGAPLHVFTVHLSLPSPLLLTRLGDGLNQLAQAERLSTWITDRSAGQPFVLAGDFNAQPESRVHRHLIDMAKLQPTPGKPHATAGIGPIRMCLDHLLAGPRITWLDGEGTHPFGDRQSPYHGLSDHSPLIARFAIV